MAYQSVVEPTIRQNVYNTIFTLINTYKTTGWTVVSSFPEKEPVFPCIIVNPAKISISKQGIHIGSRINGVEILIEMFSKASDRKSIIDIIRDKLHDIFTTYESTLYQYNLILNGDVPFVDSDIDQVTFNGQNLNTSAISISFVTR